jgi:hypothetical protein
MTHSDFSANSCSGRRPMHESAEKSECIILGRWFLRKSDRFLGTGPHYGMRQKMGFPPLYTLTLSSGLWEVGTRIPTQLADSRLQLARRPTRGRARGRVPDCP